MAHHDKGDHFSMTIDRAQARSLLNTGRFTDLFAEMLGWNRFTKDLPIKVNGIVFHLRAVAEKRGVTVFVCNQLPEHKDRMAIERVITASYREHLIIFTEKSSGIQEWQWVRREPGKPASVRKETFRRSDTGERLIQRLEGIVFSLEEEERLNTVAVSGRVNRAFDIDRVTKRFFDQFKQEHKSFLDFIRGIQSQSDREWYASLMLNRLMFVYFIQKKGFLDGDENYLQNKLHSLRDEGRLDEFHTFYRSFLLRLFREGLGGSQDPPEDLVTLIGQVPYLNGGLFETHQIERANEGIDIPDEAFDQIFAFFEHWDWHLDDRPVRADNEINPDVLGYIFEKYINQKQMGAYYTKEDITGYIATNTILPYLFDQARELCLSAFESDGALWRLLRENPDRYIYEAVKKGCDLALPPEIAAGIDAVAQRSGWNRPAPEAYALPTEIWREVIARRQRYAEVRGKLERGEIHEPNDLITYNLDFRQFAQDAIEQCEGSDLLWAFWRVFTGNRQTGRLPLSVLDPTCGSGAFLFAALNILEPLYEACLERMQAFINDADRAGNAGHLKGFRTVLVEVDRHPNRRYFILKSIIINNLYGVDIMNEAVEIAKLRLFLKLVAQVEHVEDIEALPDIDFNIRAGNTLVGFATEAEMTTTLAKGLFSKEQLPLIKERAKSVEREYDTFRNLQTQMDVPYEVLKSTKHGLQRKLADLRLELDTYLAGEYGIDQLHLGIGQIYQEHFAAWKASHQPFHWYVEFYGIMAEGGFDVIIGNPPYVASKDISYLAGAKKLAYPDLYAYILERTVALTRDDSALSMIIPLSITFSSDFALLRKRLCTGQQSWFVSFDNIPAALFEGVSQRCTIWIGHKSNTSTLNVAPLYRWRSEYRKHLMDNLSFVSYFSRQDMVFDIPKLSSKVAANVYISFFRQAIPEPAERSVGKDQRFPLGFSQAARNFISIFLGDPPCLDEHTLKEVPSSKIGYIFFESESFRYSALALLASDMFLWYWLVRGDGFDITTWIVKDYLRIMNHLSRVTMKSLSQLGEILYQRRNEALVFKKNAGKYVGNYNYRKIPEVIRRADLLLLSEIGLGKDHTLEILDYVPRVLSINTSAGEKSIPAVIKERYKPIEIDRAWQQKIFDKIDRILAQHYGFTDEELDFIINYDIKYRMGREADEGEEA